MGGAIGLGLSQDDAIKRAAQRETEKLRILNDAPPANPVDVATFAEITGDTDTDSPSFVDRQADIDLIVTASPYAAQAMQDELLQDVEDTEAKVEQLQSDVEALGTSGGYATSVMTDELNGYEAGLEDYRTAQAAKQPQITPAVTEVEQNETIGQTESNESTAQTAEERLNTAAQEYADLDGFIGPLAPGMTRADAELRLREAAVEAGLDPDQVIADLDRDLAFRNRPAADFDLTEDIYTMSRAEWTQTIGHHPELRGIYYGGGAVLGPDGEYYPLVIPTVDIGEDRYNADRFPTGPGDAPSVVNHLGEDPGWTTLGIDAGPLRLGDKPSGWERAAAFFAGTAGYQPLGGQPIRAEGYEALDISPNGYPTLNTGEAPVQSEAPPSTLPSDPPRVHYIVVEGRLTAVDSGNLQNYNRATRRAAAQMGIQPTGNTRIGAVGAGADLAVTLGQGAVAALRLDDGNNGYYQLVYEQSDDGDRRAMLRVYSITSSGGEFLIWPSYVAANENNELYGTPMSFKHPDHPVISASEEGFRVVQLDPRGN